MAFWVKEHQGFCEVFASVRSPDDMVAMPRGALGDLPPTPWTDSLLLLLEGEKLPSSLHGCFPLPI